MMIEEVKDVREKKTSGNKDRMAENGRLGVELWKSKRKSRVRVVVVVAALVNPTKKRHSARQELCSTRTPFFSYIFHHFVVFFPFFPFS